MVNVKRSYFRKNYRKIFENLGKLKRHHWVKFIISFIVGILVFYLLKYSFCFETSDAILATTALIILWYTVETSTLRKIEEERHFRSKLPIVSYCLRLHGDQISFKIVNLSDYQVSARVYLSFEYNDVSLDIRIPGYTDQDFWNLQYKQQKTGHFSVQQYLVDYGRTMELDEKNNLVLEDNSKIKFDEKAYPNQKIKFKLGVFSENEFKQTMNYQPEVYFLNVQKEKLIPEVTSKFKYWE